MLAVEGAATDPEEDFSGEERMEQEVCQNVDFSFLSAISQAALTVCCIMCVLGNVYH